MPFTVGDHARFHAFASAESHHGITWSLDLGQDEFPEVGILSRGGVPRFAVWSSASRLHCVDLRDGAGGPGTVFASPARVWAFMARRLDLPVRIIARRPIYAPAFAVELLPVWLRTEGAAGLA
jgi:hypothetical protein